MTTIRVPVTWIADGCGDKRLHTLADELHEQETEMKKARYFERSNPNSSAVTIRFRTT